MYAKREVDYISYNSPKLRSRSPKEYEGNSILLKVTPLKTCINDIRLNYISKQMEEKYAEKEVWLIEDN